MFEAEFNRLVQIDQLLKSRDHDALEVLTSDEMAHGLLSDDALNAARLLKLPATVIYLASLAMENLSKPLRFQTWLAVYQSLARGTPTEAFAAMTAKHPLKVMACALLQQNPLDAVALKKCHGGLEGWIQAAELAMDHGRFDLLEQFVRELVRRKTDAQDLLKLTKVLFNRHTHISQNAPIESLGHSYIAIRDSLQSRLPTVVRVRSTLALFASQCYFSSQNHAASIQIAQQATHPADRVHAAFDIARSYCHAGQLPESIHWLDRLTTLMCAEDAAAPPMSDAEAEEQKKAKAVFDTQHASLALLDLQTALSLVGKRAFLVSGTLLGYAREGQILAHDKDIDVGVIGWEDQFDVVNAILQSGLFAIDSQRLRGSKAYHIPVMHLQTRVSIDIFIYHADGGKLVTGVESYFGYLQKFAFTPFGLKAVKFLGIDFYVPDDVERNLLENFGNWRQSDPDYISHLQSPSTVDVGGLVYQIVGRLRALEAIRARKYEKLSRVIELMDRCKDQPCGMQARTLEQLRGVLQAHKTLEVA